MSSLGIGQGQPRLTSRQLPRLLALVAIGLIGCTGVQLSEPELAYLYNRPAQQDYPDRNPIIVIPGFLGSHLVEEATGRPVWGSFDNRTANPTKASGARLVSLPMGDGDWPEVVPDGVLDHLRFRILGLPFELEAYFQILQTLGMGGYRDEGLARRGAVDYGDQHFTCFQFPYDWRRDNAENAALLHRFIEEKRKYVQQQVKQRYNLDDYEVRFDILAHSMGGLLLRYYLRYGDQALPEDGSLPVLNWAGAANVERAILVATPNAGTVKSIRNFVNGVKYPTIPRYEPATIGTYTSGYQMLPRPRHRALVDRNDPERPVLDFLDIEFWERLGWGLLAPDQDPYLQWLLPEVESAEERRIVARQVLAENLRKARQFHEALDRPAAPPRGTELILVAGDSVLTPSVLGVDLESGEVEILEHGPGDGSVLRSSALMDERLTGAWQPTLASPVAWREVIFMHDSHLQMTKSPAFQDNVLFRLLEQPRRHGR